jgi:hypothetical protein
MNADGTVNDVNRCTHPSPQEQAALLASLFRFT